MYEYSTIPYNTGAAVMFQPLRNTELKFLPSGWHCATRRVSSSESSHGIESDRTDVAFPTVHVHIMFDSTK